MKNKLSKQSDSHQVKEYFEALFELKKTGTEYPVNLDDIWPLAYGRKQEAVRVLKSDFVEGIDYQILRNNAQNSGAGRPGVSYKLSIQCLEYFIAKKIKPVFDVYRRVFHKAIEGTIHFNNKNFITRGEYCQMYGKTIHSFNALLGHYLLEFLYAGGVWSISTDLCKMVAVKNDFTQQKTILKERNSDKQLSFAFENCEAGMTASADY